MRLLSLRNGVEYIGMLRLHGNVAVTSGIQEQNYMGGLNLRDSLLISVYINTYNPPTDHLARKSVSAVCGCNKFMCTQKHDANTKT